MSAQTRRVVGMRIPDGITRPNAGDLLRLHEGVGGLVRVVWLRPTDKADTYQLGVDPT